MHKIVVDANKSSFKLNLKELLQYRDLFLILAYRDLRVRYSQTFLGLLWAIIQPLATLIIFTIVFDKAIKVDTANVPYPLFAICGITAWSYFSFVLGQSGSSIISSQTIVTKIYFPRLVIPLSKAVVGFVDFIIAIIFIIILLIYYRIPPSSNLVVLPLFIILTIISSLSLGIWLSALTIRFRDFQHIIPFLIQFGLYATPIAYPSNMATDNLPQWATVIYYLNPMVGVVEGFRWCILGGTPLNLYSYFSFLIIFILFITSLYFFKKVERIMADII